MKPPLRLIFDDCFSKHAVAALQKLAEFSRGAVEFAHLVDIDVSGQIDDEWIPKIASDSWILITTDRGKKTSRGGKLPLVCQAAGLSYVMFSGALHQRNMFDKVRALLAVWPALAEINPGSACRGYLLHVANRGGDAFCLKCVYPPDADDGPKVQKDLAI